MRSTKIIINFEIYYACIVNFISFLNPSSDSLTYYLLLLFPSKGNLLAFKI